MGNAKLPIGASRLLKNLLFDRLFPLPVCDISSSRSISGLFPLPRGP
jgi:hypothetical protein